MSNVVELYPDTDRPSDDQAPEFRAHYLKAQPMVYVPVELFALKPTWHQREQAKRRRRWTLFWVGVAAGIVGYAWGARIIFALAVGQIP